VKFDEVDLLRMSSKDCVRLICRFSKALFWDKPETNCSIIACCKTAKKAHSSVKETSIFTAKIHVS
jgi:hypothetical protein